jgi:hypothetical protein
MSTQETTNALSVDERSTPLVGYISSVLADDNSHLGVIAYLSIDENGKPVEFLQTRAVKPSKFTEILYGKALTLHALEKAVGAMLQNLGQRPQCVFVSESRLLRPNPPADIDIVLLQNTAEQNSQQRLESQDAEVNGHRVRIAASHAGILKNVKTLLEKITWDPLEPFERLQSAQTHLESQQASG